MKPKAIIKIIIDILMTAALLFTSGYQLWGETLHEWVGAGLFVLFITHHILNWNWYKNLFRGRYTSMRIFQLVVDLLVLGVMLIQMYSGIVLSRYVFNFLPIESGLALARRLHILGAYWGVLLMSLHLGLHWNMILGMVRRGMRIKSASKIRTAICVCMGIFIAGYGGFVFVKRDFMTYIFLKSEFVFLDYSEPAVLFYMDYLAVMGLCIFVSHYISKLCRRLSKGTACSQENVTSGNNVPSHEVSENTENTDVVHK